MAVQITVANFAAVCNLVCQLVAYPQSLDPAGSPDLKHGQMRAAVNDALQELLNIYDWQDLTKDGSIDVVADFPGQAEKSFPLPEDFYRFVDQTQWVNGQRWPAAGPVSPQEWKAYVVEGMAPVTTLYWQIRQDRIWFLAPPTTSMNFAFFYMSVAQVIDETDSTLLKNIAAKNGDRFLLDSYLITLLARKKWLEWNSMDTGAATADFNTAFNSRVGADKGAPVLNLSRRGRGVCTPLGFGVPASGFGAPGATPGIDITNFYTKAESDARFLTQAEADALYLSAVAAALLYEPLLGHPSADGYLLSSTAAGVRSWIPAPTGGGGPIAASGVTNTPAGGIASTDVQAALNELDSEKSNVGHGHTASGIANTPAGNIASTDVQGALNELDSEKAATVHTHAASGVTNTPAGNIAATDVQAALNELDTEKAPKADPTFTGRATFQGYKETVITASGTSFSPDPTTGTMFVYTTTGAATLTLPTPVAGVSFTVDIIFGGAHALTVSGGGTVRWPGGSAPTFTSATGKRDSLGFKSTDTTNTHASVIGQNYAA